MSKKICILAKRREALVQEAVQQRLLLTQIVDTWRSRLVMADQSMALIAQIKQHPVLAIGASFGMLTLMRSSLMRKWFRRGWLAWQVVRKVRAFYTK
jgi:hypothetical protein